MPHSDIRGSKLVRSSPRLFAAYHVLHSLRVPRHPPNALKALDRSHFQCPPVPSDAPGWKRLSRDLRRTASLTHRRADDGSQPVPPDLNPGRAQQVLERPVSHENCPSATRVTRRQLSLVLHQDVRTTLLFTMSTPAKTPAKDQKTEVSGRNRFPPLTRAKSKRRTLSFGWPNPCCNYLGLNFPWFLTR